MDKRFIISQSQDGNIIPSTLQIGEPAVIAYETNTTVISNFRTMDIAAGDKVHHLYHIQKSFYIVIKLKIDLLQNIGGIGNVTVVPSHTK